MINKVYSYTLTDEKTIEKIVDDAVVMINHMVLPEGDCLPVHKANSNLYMTVVKGVVTLVLDNAPAVEFGKGSIINIEYGTLMSVCNTNSALLELIVIKAPGPGSYK